MKELQKIYGKVREPNKKWVNLKQKQQIWIATMLRKLYIEFVMDYNRKPNKEERQFIVATVYMEIEETDLWIPDNEISKYFESKINNYDKSIAKLILKEENEDSDEF